MNKHGERWRMFSRRSKNRIRRRRIERVLSLVVALATTYALILPAITMERATVCGLEEHIHSDGCYWEEFETIACGLEEHTHGESCYPAAEDEAPTEDEASTEDEAPTEDETPTEDEAPTENEAPTEGETPTEDENAEEDKLLVEAPILMLGVSPMADASVSLNFYSWNEYCPISFPQGNNYSCAVGSTVTVVVRGSGANYVAPQINLSGAELVSASYSCGTAGCSHNGWCNVSPAHTLVFRITALDANISAQIGGSDWSAGLNSVTVASGGAMPDPDPEPEPEPDPEPDKPEVPSYPHHPTSVVTGGATVHRLRFYNLCESGESGVSSLPNCVFEIRNESGYVARVTSGTEPVVLLPEDIPDGDFTITEVSTPQGYMRDIEHTRTFSIRGGQLSSENNIGVFMNHSFGQLDSSKTAQVEDYSNRIYEIMLDAKSRMRLYEMDPIDVIFVVDQSNSMLFPSGLSSTGKSVTLSLDGNNNVSNMEALGLDKNELYYIISDPHGTSTVWAVWYNGQAWMYQDASYYAKASQNNADGYKDPNETAIFPENRSYRDQKNAEASGTRSNGGGLGYALNDGGLGNYINNNGGSLSFEIYTAMGEYNRLHYLEDALVNMIYELADVNSQNRVMITEFTKTVDETNDCMGPLELTTSNIDQLVAEIRGINTSGGTRQDIALKHIYENHLNNSADGFSGNPNDTYTILITDGAPVLSGGSELKNLGSPSDAATTTNDTVYGQIKGWAQQVRSKSTLMSVGLGMDDVEAGKDVLEQIASGDRFFCALDDASQLVESMQRLLFDAFRPKESLNLYGDVVDEISDSFYPIAWRDAGAGAPAGRELLLSSGGRDWILLQPGDWINAEGKYTTAGAADAAGQLLRKEDGSFYVQWLNVPLTAPYSDQLARIGWVAEGSGASSGREVIASYGGKDWIVLNPGDYIDSYGEFVKNPWSTWIYGRIQQSSAGEYSVSWNSGANPANRIFYTPSQTWAGKLFVKAKEDFIGGNAIRTNKNATVTVTGSTKYLDNPTVNVHLLDMNSFESEITVYLGDVVNGGGSGPIDSLRAFYGDTRVFKILSGSGDVLNALSSAEGLEDSVFTLGYAMGSELSDEQWAAMMAGEEIVVPYVYDNQSSFGPVGQFTFSLEKTGMSGAEPGYSEHETTAACQMNGLPLSENCESPAESYFLKVKYEAYGLGESGRPAENAYNGPDGPGTEVGTGPTLNTGLGTLEKISRHDVHVISGSIRISKEFASGTVDEQDREFTFLLHREEDGEDTSGDQLLTVTIPAGKTSGSASAVFSSLRRGTYVVTEVHDEDYMVKELRILDSTNCFSSLETGESIAARFKMGTNTSDADVIGYASEGDKYTSYIDPVNGVFGEAVFTNAPREYPADVPVEKIWGDTLSYHDSEAVYVALYLDDAPVLDSEGRVRVLRLDASTDWKGVFRVKLADKDDSLENYEYFVRELSKVSDNDAYQNLWNSAVLDNDGSQIWYESALDESDILGLNGKGYIVRYSGDDTSGLTVTNLRAVELPNTGGSGPGHIRLTGIIFLCAAAVLAAERLRRRRGKEDTA